MQKDSRDSFALAMSLAELAFLLLFVLLLAFVWPDIQPGSEEELVAAIAEESTEDKPNPEPDPTKPQVSPGDPPDQESDQGPEEQDGSAPESGEPETEAGVDQNQEYDQTDIGSCWRNADGKTEYLYRIEITQDEITQENRINIFKNWKPKYDAEVTELGWDKLVGNDWTLDQYLELALPIRERGETRKARTGEPECRYYFEMFRSELRDIDTYLALQDRMYQWLDPSR